MIKSQLVIIVAGQFRHIRQRKIEKAVDAILDQIVSDGERVELRGFGSFSVKVREGRVGRNPKTGATIHVPEKKVLAFRQSREIRKRLNPVATLAEPSKHAAPSGHSTQINRRFK